MLRVRGICLFYTCTPAGVPASAENTARLVSQDFIQKTDFDRCVESRNIRVNLKVLPLPRRATDLELKMYHQERGGEVKVVSYLFCDSPQIAFQCLASEPKALIF